MRISMPADRRATIGRANALAGMSAEETVERRYRARGAEVLERRRRFETGELDLVTREGDVLVFVEVKRRKRHGPDAPIPRRQWYRLEAAAEQYISQYTSETGAEPCCRFDVALIGHDGTLQLIENACRDEQY